MSCLSFAHLFRDFMLVMTVLGAVILLVAIAQGLRWLARWFLVAGPGTGGR